MVFSLGYGYHCQNIRGDPPTKCYAFKEQRKGKCAVCEEAGFYSDVASEGATHSSQRTPTQTVRYQPVTLTSKKRKSVNAVATVVSNNIISYWDHLKQAKEALLNEIITQEQYDDLTDHFLKKLKEM